MKRVEGHCKFQTITADQLLAAADSMTAGETLGVELAPAGAREEPLRKACFFGSLPFRHFFAPEVGAMIHFQGWPDRAPRFLLATFFDPPWLGVIEPASEDQARASRVFLSDAPPALTEQIYKTLTSKCPAAKDFHDVPFWKALARQVGLMDS